MKLSNKAARFGWWFSACFLLMCAVFTYMLIRDGLSRTQTYSPSAFGHGSCQPYLPCSGPPGLAPLGI